MITLVGVGHVFDISDQVRQVILEQMPGAVCVELDPYRYQALLHPEARRSAPAAYRVLAEFQKRLAREFGGEVGREMLTATEAAREIGAEVLFIDTDASALFTKLWREMPVREKAFLMFSAITGFFLTKSRIERELEKFEEDEEAYLQSFGEQFPTLKRVLIDDRNTLMAARIEKATRNHPEVLAVVGDGHVEGILELLGREDVRVVRLRDLRAMESAKPEEASKGNAEVSIRFDYSSENFT